MPAINNLKLKTTNCLKMNQTCSHDDECCSKVCKNSVCEKNIIRENWIQLAIVFGCVAGVAVIFGIGIFIVKKCKKIGGGNIFKRTGANRLVSVDSKGYINPDN